MCGRITQKSQDQLGLKVVSLIEPLDAHPRYNGAPGQQHLVIRENPKTGERTLDQLWWGLIPHWCVDSEGGRKPINAKSETVASLPTFRDAYRRRRCLIPVDSFFEWKAIKGGQTKASLCHREEERRTVCLGRHMGELVAARDRRVGPHLRDHHVFCQRSCEEHP